METYLNYNGKEYTKLIGTGIVIYPNLVLTCAHLVYNRIAKETEKSVRFVQCPGGENEYVRKSEVDFIIYPDEFKYANDL